MAPNAKLTVGVKRIESRKDLQGNLLVGFFGVVILLFVAMVIGISMRIGRVSKADIEKRHVIATHLASRTWKAGASGGTIVDGHVDDATLPPELPAGTAITETESYSDMFKTMTVFEFEIGKDKSRCSIQIRDDAFQVYR